MKKLFRILLPLALFALSSAPALAGDIFMGTLEIHDGKPVLVRCDLVKNTYLLVDDKGSSEVYLKQLTDLGVSEKKPFQASIFGDAAMEGDIVFLKVDSIEDIKAGSCHLF